MHDAGHYELLGVSKNASTAEIKSAYRVKARDVHPDAGGSPDEFHALQLAYETLSDPSRRTAYDQGKLRPSALTAPARAPRQRDFGEDPSFTAEIPVLTVRALPWWHRGGECARPATPAAPGHAPVAIMLGWLLLVIVPIMAGPLLLTFWLLLATSVAIWLVRGHLALAHAHREFAAEFGRTVVFGRPGGDPDQWAERLTADLLERYLTRLPAVRVFHGLALPGSVFADVDHAVLAGRRLVLIESKTWLPGHYEADETGMLWRNDRRFRGGATGLPESIEAYRDLLPDVEIRGALLIYPSRAGEVTAEPDGPASVPQPMTPEQFVHEIGGWLAAQPSTVDVDVLRLMLAQVV